MDDIASIKCFDPKHFDDDVPNRSWGIDRLSERARRQYEAILRQERGLAGRYWELGETLDLVYQETAHGHWRLYLKSLGISTSKDHRARKIHQTFDSAEAVQEMSVDEACGTQKDRTESPKRKKSVKKKRQHSKETTEVDAKSAILQDVGGQCAALEDEAKDMDMFSKRALLPVARLALEALTRLVQELSS